MPTHKLTIKGIGYHDFKGRLDELYQIALGRRMTLSIEHENEAQWDAVIAYMGNAFVGYVRTEERLKAVSLIHQSGKQVLFAYVTAINREMRELIVDVNTQGEIEVEEETVRDILANWEYDGQVLPQDEAELRLKTMLSALDELVSDGVQWDADMEEYLQYVEHNAWRNISNEAYQTLRQLLATLTAAGEGNESYRSAASRIQSVIDSMGSPHTRKKQVEHIIALAKSKEIERLVVSSGDTASEAVMQLPDVLGDLFLTDPCLLMGRLWYLRQPYVKVRAIITLLAMMMHKSRQILEDAVEMMDADALYEQSVDTYSDYYIAPGHKTDVVKVLWALLNTDPVKRHDGKPVSKEAFINFILSKLGEAKATRVGQTLHSAKNTDTFLTIFNDLTALAQKYYLK